MILKFKKKVKVSETEFSTENLTYQSIQLKTYLMHSYYSNNPNLFINYEDELFHS